MSSTAGAIRGDIKIPPPRSGIYGLLRFKQALAAAYPLQEGFGHYKLVRTPDCASIQEKSIESQYEIARTRGARFIEIAPAGEVFTLAAPRVIGSSNHRALRAHTRSLYTVRFDNVNVRGRSALVQLDDMVALDYQGDELARIDDQLALDSAVFHATNDIAWIISPKDGIPSTDVDEAFNLIGTHTPAFGHWLWEYLPKYAAARLWGGLPDVPVLIDRALSVNHKQALELLLPSGGQLIELKPHVTARVARLWCAPSLMHMPVFPLVNDRFDWSYIAGPAKRFAPLYTWMVQRWETPLTHSTICRRVYLARKEMTHRKLLNHEAIESVVRTRGFSIVFPEQLSFVDQIKLMRGADFVIGPEGSGMMLTLLARPGTQVCILDHTYTWPIPVYTGLLQELGVDTVVVTGEDVNVPPGMPHWTDYRVDENGFAAFLDQWLMARTP